MFNKIIKYRFWISGGIILALGVWFLGTMLKMIGISGTEPDKGSLLERAEQYCSEGAYKKSLDSYEKILILDPDSASAVLNLGIIYDDYISNKNRAVELYKRYLELEPQSEKKEMIEEWIVSAARESLGMQTAGNNTYGSKLTKLEKEIEKLLKENANLEKETENLSGKLYTIQAEHQKEIQSIQEQRNRLATLVTNSRMRVSDISKALKAKEDEKIKMQAELEEALEFQNRFRKDAEDDTDFWKERARIQELEAELRLEKEEEKEEAEEE